MGVPYLVVGHLLGSAVEGAKLQPEVRDAENGRADFDELTDGRQFARRDIDDVAGHRSS